MPFPPGFLIGAAVSALQVEGGNVNTDWWEWEHRTDAPVAAPAMDACDHYHRYAEDIAIMASLGLNAFRFTIEWARIEPERDRVSHAELAHYRRVLEECHAHGITPVVTLQHFSLPRWVARAGGWTHPGTAARFQRFAELVAKELGELIGWIVTINEPNVLLENSYMHGVFPPGAIADLQAKAQAQQVLGAAHAMARAAIKSQRPQLPVGFSLSMLAPAPQPGAEDAALAWAAATYGPYLALAADDDFLGVQCYSTQHIATTGPVPPPPGVERTQMGWEHAPEAAALTCALLAQAAPSLPLLITETGIATSDDSRRVDYVDRGLAALDHAIAAGADVRGYLHWSLLDNYEWNLGYAKTFGLIGYDPVTFERSVKPSAETLGRWALTSRQGAAEA